MIDRSTLAYAYSRNPSSVERLASWLEIECSGVACIAAVVERLRFETESERLHLEAEARIAAIARGPR